MYYNYLLQASGCHLNKFLISFNLIMCIVLSVISILPKIQEGILIPIIYK